MTGKISPYIAYCKDMMQKMQGDTTMTNKEKVRKCGETWHELTDDQKAHYKEMALRMTEEKQRQM